MAQQVQVTVVDDLDGSEASESVQFGLDGRHYEIDLSAENAARLRASLARYVAAARRGAGERHRPGSLDSVRSARRAMHQAETRKLRALAANARTVPATGRSQLDESPKAIDPRPAAGPSGQRVPIVTDPFQIPPTTP